MVTLKVIQPSYGSIELFIISDTYQWLSSFIRKMISFTPGSSLVVTYKIVTIAIFGYAIEIMVVRLCS
jgi:hypothetical protein